MPRQIFNLLLGLQGTDVNFVRPVSQNHRRPLSTAAMTGIAAYNSAAVFYKVVSGHLLN